MAENVLKKIVKYVPRKLKKYILGDLVQYNNRIQGLETAVKYLFRAVAGMDFQGQFGQDMFAYMYFNGKKDGFYIDIGANDGKTINNTLIFENLGWHGICVEPLPEVFEQLCINRRCDCFNAAIANMKSDSVEFVRARGVETLSGLNEQMSKAHKERIMNEKGEIERITVKTVTFDDLMSGYPEKRYIDFMSIDVEGAEMSILETINFKKFSFGLITVENNEEIKGDGKRLKKYMENRGYKVYIDLGVDIMFMPQ